MLTIAAAERDDDRASRCALIACAMRNAAYTDPGNGTDSSTRLGWWRSTASSVSVAQRLVDQVQRRGQRLGQRIEVGWLCASDSA